MNIYACAHIIPIWYRPINQLTDQQNFSRAIGRRFAGYALTTNQIFIGDPVYNTKSVAPGVLRPDRRFVIVVSFLTVKVFWISVSLSIAAPKFPINEYVSIR